MIVIRHTEVESLLPMSECIDLMGEALQSLARGQAINPLRSGLQMPDKNGVLGMMPSLSEEPPALAIKVVAVFPGNRGIGLDSHQGAVLLFDRRNGCLEAVIDGSAVTAIRTAAVSGLATRLLAHEAASDLAILGTGVQARSHLEAMRAVRPIGRVRVWSKTPARVAAFADRESERHGMRIEPMGSARATIEGAEIICTTTFSQDPVLHGEWLTPGAHINAVGASAASERELDTSAVVRSSLFVDQREAALEEAGDFLIAREEGAIDDGHIRAEIGAILMGVAEGRRSSDEITLFKSVGLAIEDLAAASYLYTKAMESGAGTRIDFGGKTPSDGLRPDAD